MKGVDIKLKNIPKISGQRNSDTCLTPFFYLCYLFLSFELNFKFKINYYES